MSCWPSVPLARIVKPIERAEVPVTGNSYRQVGVKLWGVGAYEREPIDGGGTRYKTLSRVEANDIIVNKIWARNGSVAVIPANLAGCYVSGEFPTFTPIPGKLDSRWFHWITKTRFFWDQCDLKSRGTSGKNRIRPEHFLEIEIPLPPVPEQRRIVARTEELAAKINEARELRRQAEEQSGALIASFISEAIEAPYAEKEAQFEPLEKACELITDGTHDTPAYVEDGVPLITAKNVFWDRIDTRNVRFISRDDHLEIFRRCPVRRDDILFINIGATTGTAKKVDVDLEFSLKNVALLRPSKNRLATDYLVYILQGRRIRGQIAQRQAQTCQQFFSLRDIRNLTIPVPSLNEQTEIVRRLNNLRLNVDGIKKFQTQTNAELDALLPSILDRAFNGKL
jgi:type I restriction enzyme S subunit